MSDGERRGVGESLASEVRAHLELLGLRSMSAHYVPDRDVVQLYWRSLREPSKDDGLSFPATVEWKDCVVELLRAHARSSRGGRLGAADRQQLEVLSPPHLSSVDGPTVLSPYTVYYHPRVRRTSRSIASISAENAGGASTVRGLLWSSRRHTGTLLLKHPGR
jgi:hypothetical protein